MHIGLVWYALRIFRLFWLHAFFYFEWKETIFDCCFFNRLNLPIYHTHKHSYNLQKYWKKKTFSDIFRFSLISRMKLLKKKEADRMMKRLILRVESQNMIRTLKEAQAGRKKSQLLFIYLFIFQYGREWGEG